MILERIKKKGYLITDGAMGTYYSEFTGDYTTFSEFANLENSDVIKKIHLEYINSGAELIRTNTFSANSFTLGLSREEIRKIIARGYEIAVEAVSESDILIGASIGPISTNKSLGESINVLEEYKFVVDCFLDAGAKIFIFETFSSVEHLKEISAYIKNKKKEAFIITQFAITPDGYTREGISIARIVSEAKAIKEIDIYGFNCGSGPTHMGSLLKKVDFTKDVITVLPNAGYPEVINERTIYVNNPEYFAEKMLYIKELGGKILGGCCGTTPEHIRKLVQKLNTDKYKKFEISVQEDVNKLIINKESNNFIKKLKNNEFVVAVELDPPMDTAIDKIIQGAKVCKENNIDLVTVADSPMSKVRVDSIMMAAKIKREIGIDTMPHLCCRDKNINAIRSNLLASHIEDIRNILAVTGDPVYDGDKIGVKSVFNLNSFKLIELIKEMNKEVFNEDSFSIGGALNLNVVNKSLELERMYKKVERGAIFFLTQPIYDDETIEFLSKIKKDGSFKILGGIMPIVTYRNAQFLNNELPGIKIPQEFVDRFHVDMSREEAEEVGVNLSAEIINKIKPYVDGLYMMTPFNRIEMIMKILKRVHLL